MRILRILLLISGGAVLAGCGADGEPIQPTMNASVGVGSSGTHGAVGVGVRRGGLGVYLGL
ncbi:argininosuccinate lyase [uncultured Ruegeria sp.]|uniref:argininosuccinate lyase n=1 Tax=uncultured Ruegeria sp. TaxID=259304 RepID=UPI00260BC18B|nr:argininosuccinate lyase [uncultured Ruegeria sp.]